MTSELFAPLKGHCSCKAVTYEITAPFLCVNCCHCTWCQRETGSAFVLNGLIEASNFGITSKTRPIVNNTSSASGTGQLFARCPTCFTVIYSHYDGDGTTVKFVRVGTLDDKSKNRVRPTAHIFTSTKVPWIDLEKERERGIPIFGERYKRIEVWTREANERFDALKQKIDAAK